MIRPETTVERSSTLRPAFDPVTGTVTAGTSSALSDGAAAMLLMSESRAASWGLSRALASVQWRWSVATRPLWVMARFRPQSWR